MADDNSEVPKCPSGLPPWMATFADMMTLLLCFFVLLTSTSVQDAKKYKAMVESMRKAFGVTGEIAIDQTQMVTTKIANEFRSAQKAPAVINDDIEKLKEKAMKATLAEIQNQGEKIKEDLEGEIGKGLITVDIKGLQIVMRIEEKGSFSSGSAILKHGFEPVMDKITDSIKQSKGNIRVAGHTDDIPITTSSYRSNWELSSSRAVTVAHYMLTDKGVSPGRIAIEGYADTKPLLPNNSAENRAKNRRVEIILVQEDPTIGLNRKNSPETDPSFKPE
jgi:chemotaxis protein MotB